MKRGDLVTVAAGGGFGGKPRPGIIVQSGDYSNLDTVVVALFTSSLTHSALRLRFEPDAESGLVSTSDLMTDVLITVRRDRVGRVIGALSAEEMARVDRALLVFLGLAG